MCILEEKSAFLMDSVGNQAMSLLKENHRSHKVEAVNIIQDQNLTSRSLRQARQSTKACDFGPSF